MGRKLRFDVRKQKRPSRKTELTENDVKAFCSPAPTMVDAETQTDNQWFSSDEEVQTEPEETESVTVAVGTQTEPDVLMQVHEIVTAQNEETTKFCEGIVDEKYTPLVNKYEGLFKDATGKQ